LKLVFICNYFIVKTSHILGLNARTQLFSYPFNNARGRSTAASKLKTKTLLKKAGIPVPMIYAKFAGPKKLLNFNWSKLPDSFALKPSKGLGGEGIIVVKKRVRNEKWEAGKQKKISLLWSKISQHTSHNLSQSWITTQKTKVSVEDLKLHVLDILEGAYSMGSVPDAAFIEEYVGRHKSLKRYSFRGTPDIRVIVFNQVPVMAMLRLPTRESGGRANLHQGAIGVGIDMATGITTRAYWHGKYIHVKPGSKRKLHGIRIPQWENILITAVRAGSAARLGYYGADVVLHPEKGPMILELNYQPGLSIQLANGAGLRKRLDRVEDMKVLNPEHGVRIARALFSTDFSDRVRAEGGIKTISAISEITIKGIVAKDQRKKVVAKVDTGAWRTSVNKKLADELGLTRRDNLLWSKKVKSTLGEEERPIVAMTYWLGGRKIRTAVSVAKRTSLKFPVIIGRKDLKGFLIDAHIPFEEKREKVEKAKKLK
jgi:alpha-L-glutamate ligase-like protein